MIANVLYANGCTYKKIDRKGKFIGYSIARDGRVIRYVIFKIGTDRNGTEYLPEIPMNFKNLDTPERFMEKWKQLINNME